MEEARNLSLGVSIFLLVVGAILTFAVDVSASGFSINTVGIILMIAGALGLVLSLLFWSSFSPYRRDRTVAGPDTVVEERRIERDLPSPVRTAEQPPDCSLVAVGRSAGIGAACSLGCEAGGVR